MKSVFTAAALALVSTSAFALNDGSYAIGPQIFDLGAATPRYVHLQVEGNSIDVTFVALSMPDAATCAQTGMCEAVWPGLRLTMDGDKVAATSILRDDYINDMVTDENAATDQLLYIAPVIAAIESGSPEILPVSMDGLMRTTSLVQILEVSAEKLQGCEVRQMSALEAAGGHDSFLQALDYQVAMARLMMQERRIGPTIEMTDQQYEAARAEAAPLQKSLMVMSMSQMAFASGTDVASGISAAQTAGERILKDSGVTFDDVMGPHLANLPAASRLMRNIGETAQSGTDLAAAACKDFTFGL